MNSRNDILSRYPDVKAKIVRKCLRPILFAVIWCVAVIIVMIMLYPHINVGAAIGIGFLLCAVGFQKCGVFRMLLDHDWEGTIEEVKYHSYTGVRGVVINPSTSYDCTEEWLTIRLQSGEIMKKTITRNPELDAGIYKAGDTVHYFRGTNYPLILTRKESEAPRICVFCSDVQPFPDRNTCDFCGMSLLSDDSTAKL